MKPPFRIFFPLVFSSLALTASLPAEPTPVPDAAARRPDADHQPANAAPLAYWKFNDAAGPVARDDGGRRYDGTLKSFSSLAPDHGVLPGTSGWTSNGRLDFDGRGGYVQTTLPLSELTGRSFTLEARVTHNDAAQTWSPVFGSSQGVYSPDAIFFFGKAQGLDALHVNLGGLTDPFTVTYPGSLVDGKLHHVALVYDRSRGTLTVYFDHQEVYRKSGVSGRLTAASNLLIGATGHAADERWNGYLAEARVTLDVLTPERFLRVAPPPIKVIFDTDMSGDCDDTGALAVLHQFANDREAEILAVMVDDGDPYTPACVDAINTYYGRPHIPIGTVRNPVYTTKNSPYTKAVATSFPNDVLNRTDLPDAVSLYRRVLAAAPDHGVVLITTGFLTNVSRLLDSGPDRYSQLSGTELLRRKVSYAVTMGGTYPASSTPPYNFAEYNFTNDAYATLQYVSRFPRPIMFSGFEIGVQILTGATLYNPQANPVCLAYQLYVGAGKNRNSWDVTAAFYAVRGLAGVWKAQTTGSLMITDSVANDKWVGAPAKNQGYLVQYAAPETVAGALEPLITAPPRNAR